MLLPLAIIFYYISLDLWLKWLGFCNGNDRAINKFYKYMSVATGVLNDFCFVSFKARFFHKFMASVLWLKWLILYDWNDYYREGWPEPMSVQRWRRWL